MFYQKKIKSKKNDTKGRFFSKIRMIKTERRVAYFQKTYQ